MSQNETNKLYVKNTDLRASVVGFSSLIAASSASLIPRIAQADFQSISALAISAKWGSLTLWFKIRWLCGGMVASICCRDGLGMGSTAAVFSSIVSSISAKYSKSFCNLRPNISPRCNVCEIWAHLVRKGGSLRRAAPLRCGGAALACARYASIDRPVWKHSSKFSSKNPIMNYQLKTRTRQKWLAIA